MSREEDIRHAADVRITASEVIEDLTGQDIPITLVNDVLDNMPAKTKRFHPYIPIGERRTRAKAQAKRQRRKRKMQTDEQRLSALKIKLMSGDPNHPHYDKRMAHAKKNIALATSLPSIARQKWANPTFQKEMEEKGFVYDPASYRGWLPYEDAKAIQRKLIRAKSRGEYEFFVKLFELKFLPARPDRVYEEEWEGWSDFLGTINQFRSARVETVDPSEYRSFYDALTFARSLKLKSAKQWREACKDGKVPLDVPMDPHNVYPDQFVDIEHWLGTTPAIAAVLETPTKVLQYYWVMYQDGRMNNFWFTKMQSDKYEAFVQLPQITVIRTYMFEGELAEAVWEVIERMSSQEEDDRRERYVDSLTTIGEIRVELDSILMWKP